MKGVRTCHSLLTFLHDEGFAKRYAKVMDLSLSLCKKVILSVGPMGSKSQCLILFQIIDSIMALFRVDFCGRGELADRQQKLAQMLSKLQKISEGKSKSHVSQILCSDTGIRKDSPEDFAKVYPSILYNLSYFQPISFLEYNVAVFITNQVHYLSQLHNSNEFTSPVSYTEVVTGRGLYS